jgi:hypothetical protein
MKKDDALDKLDRAGHTINNVNASAWNTALNPTQYGWGKSILSIASIPVLSAASIGHLVSHAVVRQINPDTFEKLTEFGGKPKDKPEP